MAMRDETLGDGVRPLHDTIFLREDWRESAWTRYVPLRWISFEETATVEHTAWLVWTLTHAADLVAAGFRQCSYKQCEIVWIFV